jgi:ribonuclease HI
MKFKGNKVWLSVDQDGKPLVQKGKVLIKYQLDQDYEYWVHETSIKPVDPTQHKSKSPKKKTSGKKLLKEQKKKSVQQNDPVDESVSKDAICIFTDGASSGNPGPSGIGVLLRYQNNEKELSKYIGQATNNIAELEAIRLGLLELKNTKLPVRIFTDSSYVYGVLTLGWKAKKNLKLIRSIREIMLKFDDLKFIKVTGHSGVAGNERADLLATSAIKKGYKP